MFKTIKDAAVAIVLLIYIVTSNLLPGPVDEIIAGIVEALQIITIVGDIRKKKENPST